MSAADDRKRAAGDVMERQKLRKRVRELSDENEQLKRQLAEQQKGKP